MGRIAGICRVAQDLFRASPSANPVGGKSFMNENKSGLRPVTENRNGTSSGRRTELRRLGIVATIAASLSLMLIGATSAISASGGLSMTSSGDSTEERAISARYARMWEE